MVLICIIYCALLQVHGYHIYLVGFILLICEINNGCFKEFGDLHEEIQELLIKEDQIPVYKCMTTCILK